MNIPFFPSIQWTHIICHLVSELHFQAAVLCFIAFEMSWDSDVWCETFGRKERARYFCLISYQLEEVCNENYAMLLQLLRAYHIRRVACSHTFMRCNQARRCKIVYYYHNKGCFSKTQFNFLWMIIAKNHHKNGF